MTGPGFRTIMLPLLRMAGDGGVHSIAEAVDHLADHFSLSEEGRSVLVLTWGARGLQPLAGPASALHAWLGTFLFLAVPLSLFDTIFAVFPFNGFNGRRLWDWHRPLWLLLSLAAAAILFV